MVSCNWLWCYHMSGNVTSHPGEYSVAIKDIDEPTTEHPVSVIIDITMWGCDSPEQDTEQIRLE